MSLTKSVIRVALTAVALAASAGAANAQFISSVDSTFTGTATTAAPTSVASGATATVPATTWQVRNALSTPSSFWVAGTGDASALSPDAAAGAGNYLAIGDRVSAAILLTPNSFTAISGGYTYDIGFAAEGFAVITNVKTNGNPSSAPTATAAAVNYSWTVVQANSYASALTGGGTIFGSGNGTTNATYGWQNVAGTFNATAGHNYTDLYFVVTNTNVPTSVQNGVNVNTSNYYLGIDNVTAVPEPETYALMLAGLGAVGFMGRRRKHG